MRNDYAIACVVGKRKVEKITQTFSTRLVGRRNALGLSQQELAKRAGISLRSVQNYEGREAYPTGRTLRSLCAVLDVPIAYLMGSDDAAAPCAPVVESAHLAEDARQAGRGYSTRADRVITRMSELTDLEYARTEPAILSMIEAVLGARPRRPNSVLNSGAVPTAEALAKAQMRRDVADIVAARPSTTPPPPASKPAMRNTAPDSSLRPASTPS